MPPLLLAKMRKSVIRATKTDKINCATFVNVYYHKRLNITNNKIYSDLKVLCSYYNFKISILAQMKVKY